MGVKVNRCDIVPPLSGSAGVPVNAPYLLNGVDPSGLLTAEVNVLALATPQPFIATAPIAGGVGLPITLAYDNGVGAVGTGVGLQFKAQNDLDTTKNICTVVTRLTDATDTSESSEIDLGVLAAGAEQTALTIADAGLSLNGSTGAKTIATSKGNLTVSTTGAGNGVTVSSAAASADLTGTTTATVSAGSGAATLRSTAAGALVTGATTAVVTAGTGDLSLATTGGEITTSVNALPITAIVSGGMEFRGTGTKLVSYQTGDLSVGTAGAGNDLALSSGGDLTITAGTTAGALSATGQSTASLSALAGNLTLNASGAGDVLLSTGAVSRWAVLATSGILQAQGAARKVANIAPGTTTGDAVAYEQILATAIIAPTAGGAFVAMTPGAIMAQQCEIEVTAAAGVYLVRNATGATIRVLGIDALLPSTFAAASISAVANAATLFAGTGLAALAVPTLPVAAGYTALAASVADGANITINATDATLAGPATAFVTIRYQVV